MQFLLERRPTEFVRIAIECKADVTAVDEHGFTAIIVNPHCADILVNAGANPIPEMPSDNPITLLYFADEKDREHIAVTYIEPALKDGRLSYFQLFAMRGLNSSDDATNKWFARRFPPPPGWGDVGADGGVLHRWPASVKLPHHTVVFLSRYLAVDIEARDAQGRTSSVLAAPTKDSTARVVDPAFSWRYDAIRRIGYNRLF